MEELAAITGGGTKLENETKAFISSQCDHYRLPYARRSSDNPRSCVFVGTTNYERFLTDPTGNRRWYPLKCQQTDAAFLYEHEEEIKHDIEQCYAEMYDAWKNNKALASPTPKLDLQDTIRKSQEASEIDDPRIGLIHNYFRINKNKEYVCIEEIREKALNGGRKSSSRSRAESIEIGKLLREKLHCISIGQKYFPDYGIRRAFEISKDTRKEVTGNMLGKTETLVA